jgi:hypothetical protein
MVQKKRVLDILHQTGALSLIALVLGAFSLFGFFPRTVARIVSNRHYSTENAGFLRSRNACFYE